MSVSRKGKRGRRAGFKKLRPVSRNNRVSRNASLKRLTGHQQEQKGERRYAEEFVWAIVKDTVTGSRDGMLDKEDVCSEVLLEILDAGGTTWEEDEIRDFCRNAVRKKLNKHFWRAEKTMSERFNDDVEEQSFFAQRSIIPATQETHCLAVEAKGFLKSIPLTHRGALETLADGGNPVEVALENGITVPEAMRLIKEARRFVQLVDPSYD